MPLPKRIPRSGSAKTKDSAKQRILANRYRVEKKLGSGNFGTVWLVTDLKAKEEKDKQKALKEIPVGDLQPDETLEANHEASLLRNLDHPGIVKFFDSFIEGEFFCIVTEFCEGGDLGSKITDLREKGKHLTEPLVIEWTIQLLLAVQYIHDRRVLHRDLKSSNIFVKNNMLKIGDFGISRILMGTADMASTFVGTPYYMSPEVLKHEGYNSKSDVWSIGCILYELVSLTHAFEGQSLMGIMYKIVEGNLPDWPKDYSPELGYVFSRICDKDPAKRLSASEALKLPFIAKQMERLKDTMIDKHQMKEHKDTVNRESQQLASALKQHKRLDELKKESEERRWRNLSPRERMRLRKQREADQQALRLQEATQQQYQENKAMYSENKQLQNPFETQLHFNLGHWAARRSKIQEGGARDDHAPHGVQHHHNPRLKLSRPFTAPIGHYQAMSDEEEDSDDDVVIPHRKARTMNPYSYASPDDRPITPMKNTMIYNREHSTLDFEDGIPGSADLAETYYSQYQDEFEDDDEGEETLVANEEIDDFIHYMQTALNKSDALNLTSTLVAADSSGDPFGPSFRDVRIKNLRAEAERKLGADQFAAAYDYLKRVRYPSDAATVDEPDVMRGLARIVRHPNDCLLVDQLLFLEAQAEKAL